MLDKGLRSDQEAGGEYDNDALGPAHNVFEVRRPVSHGPGPLRHDCHSTEASGDPGCTLLRAGILDIIGNEVILLHGISFLRQCMASMRFHVQHSAHYCPYVASADV